MGGGGGLDSINGGEFAEGIVMIYCGEIFWNVIEQKKGKEAQHCPQCCDGSRCFRGALDQAP